MATPGSGYDEELLFLYLLSAVKNTKKRRRGCTKSISDKNNSVNFTIFASNHFRTFFSSNKIRIEKIHTNSYHEMWKIADKLCIFQSRPSYFRSDFRDLRPLSVLIARLGRRSDSCNQTLTDYRCARYRDDEWPVPVHWKRQVPRKQKLWTVIKMGRKCRIVCTVHAVSLLF